MVLCVQKVRLRRRLQPPRSVADQEGVDVSDDTADVFAPGMQLLQWDFISPGIEELPCLWSGCDRRRLADLPICVLHAATITCSFNDFFDPPTPRPPRVRDAPNYRRYVYYVMVGPMTVKIGTTLDLTQRLRNLRTEPQYVVAIEPGGYDVEKQRHLEFAKDRTGRFENFMLSDQLKSHIDSLADRRDDLMAKALAGRQIIRAE